MSNIDNKLNELRAEDGFYRDGIEVLRLMIEEINASNLADDLTLDLPAGAVTVELNGGVPMYLVQDPSPHRPGEFEQASFSEIVGWLEGTHSRIYGPADEELTDLKDLTDEDLTDEEFAGREPTDEELTDLTDEELTDE